MFHSLVALLCLQACVLAAPGVGTAMLRRGHGRIINGTEASVSDFPWMLSLQYLGQHWCGASIISSDWALTAAHCVAHQNVEAMTLRAGTSTMGSGGVVLNISQAIVHDRFFIILAVNDFAVIQVSEPFPLGPDVQPVGLPPDEYDAPAGLPVTATGWGSTQDDPLPVALQMLDIEVQDRSVCQEQLGYIHKVTQSMLCAGHSSGSVCHGDSGGPLVHQGVQLGTVSWGQPDCLGSAAVFGNVASARDWVRNTTGA